MDIGCERQRIPNRTRRGVVLATVAASMMMAAITVAQADAPRTIVGYQPMISTGLAARQPFEAWFVFDKSSDPMVPGYAVPAGAEIRITFPKPFTPTRGMLSAVMLAGWPQGSIPVKFSTAVDGKNHRSIVIHFEKAIAAGAVGHPGLKAIHLRTAEINPTKAGDYPIAIEFIDAGPLTGRTTATVHITAAPVPNIAAYNQLHQGRNEDWQHVKANTEASLPVDFLITRPNASRSSISLKVADGGLTILADGKPIGSVATAGVPVTLTPVSFGPGFARLGIIEMKVKAGASTGAARIIASLNGGTRYAVHVLVEEP